MLSLLDPAVPLTDVAEHVRKRWRQHQRVELELSLGLRRLYRDNIHRGTGIGNFASWAEAEFDIPAKLVWTFSMLGQHLERLPLLVQAMASGAVTYTKAREFAPYIEPENQEDWIEFAKTATNRALEQRVGRWNAARQGKEFVETKKVTSRLNGLEAQAVRQAREKLLKDTREFVSEDKALSTLAKLFVEGKLHTVQGELVGREFGEEAGEAARIPASARPYLAIQPCPSCLTTYVPVPGASMPVAAFEFLDRLRRGVDGTQLVNLVREYLCDCQDAMHRRDECPRHLPKVEIPEAAVSRYVPADVRRRIEARDGFRCRVPGCGNQLPLEGGHIHAFAENGPPTTRNMATQCRACNALIAEERLRVVGVAPYEKYYRADGTFLGWGYDPTPFPRPGAVEGSQESQESQEHRGDQGSQSDHPDHPNQHTPGVSHVGQDDPDDGAGRIAESRPIWGAFAAP